MQVDAGIKFFVFLVIVLIAGFVGLGAWQASPTAGILIWFGGFVAAWLLSASIRMVAQWQRAIVLRLGKFSGLRGPGLFFMVPLVDTVSSVVDLRTISSTFRAEQTITADTVPVDVDAVLFWRVIDPEKAVLEVAQYDQSVGWAAQTALRDVIGRSTLADVLSGREKIDAVLKQIIDSRTEPWGVKVESVEIRDVIIPGALQDAMSRQAQAERERQARIILGESETQIASKFMEAAVMYEKSPVALHLRAMNMLYEGMKDKGSLIIVPSSALETMNLGGGMQYASLKQQADAASDATNLHANAPGQNPTPALPSASSTPPVAVPPIFPGTGF
ncbi:MAG TPA: SPFH domain-containing protein [Abditibacteriaceae bacterium]|jgi:regulator of protease activity HflC (stomatin/prohibitin superfamily)|nr:SPFH domain-containing protein [Abditibacteriaceae bacterium]